MENKLSKHNMELFNVTFNHSLRPKLGELRQKSAVPCGSDKPLQSEVVYLFNTSFSL